MRERRLVFSNYLGSDHELIYRTSRTLNLGGLGPNIIPFTDIISLDRRGIVAGIASLAWRLMS
jgi:hypothetical protein